MRKTVIFTLCIFFSCLGYSINKGGKIVNNEIWSADTIKIVADIEIIPGIKVTINPGVKVMFTGHYRISSKGIIKSLGNAFNPILFFPNDTTTGWDGIQISSNSSTDFCEFSFCEFSYSKHSIFGGAIYLNDVEKFIISDSKFFRNYTTGESYEGGAAIAVSGSVATIQNCTFSNNKTSDSFAVEGGAIFCYYSTTSILNCTFDSNYGYHGGAVSVIGWGSKSLIINNLFKNNQSSSGGAIHVMNCENSFLSNNTYVHNFSRGGVNFGGGALCIDGASVEEMNAIYWNNTCSTGENVYVGGSFDFGNYYIHHSCLKNGRNSTFLYVNGSRPTAKIVSFGIMVSEPLFSSDANGNYELTAGSPCINAGKNETGIADFPSSDLSDKARIVHQTIDMGAYEFQLLPTNRLIVENIENQIVDFDSTLILPLYIASYPPDYSVTILQGPTGLSVKNDTIFWTTSVLDKGKTFPVRIKVDNQVENKTLNFDIRVRKDKELFGTITSTITWPYDSLIVIGNITIASGAKLKLNPGTVVCFEGFYSIDVKGSVFATGLENNQIKFVPLFSDRNWNGIRLENIYSSNDSTIFRYCYLEKSLYQYNGGLFSIISSSKTAIEHCILRNNSSSNGNGGAIYVYNALPLIRNNIFENNVAKSGGALNIANYYSSVTKTSLKLSGNTFVNNNSSLYGGAISASGNIQYIDNYFEGNKANKSTGGAINHTSDTTLIKFVNNIFNANQAGSYAGAIAIGSTKALISNCTFVNNSAVTNCTAIYAYNMTLPTRGSNVHIVNSIFWSDSNNSLPFLKNDDNSQLLTEYTALKENVSGGFNNIQLFEKPFDPGKSDFSLIGTTSCIDAGLNSAVTNNSIQYDIRGNWRIMNKKVDLGAVEYKPEFWPVLVWPFASGITYGDSLNKSILTGSESEVPGIFSFVNPEHIPEAGKQSVPVCFVPAKIYLNKMDTVFKNINLEVEKKVLQVIVENDTIVYGQQPDFNLRFNGFIKNDSIDMLDEPLVGVLFSDSTPDAGFNAGVLRIYPVEDDNYSIILQNGDLIVNKAILNVYAIDTVYDLKIKKINFDMFFDGFVNGEDRSVIDELPVLSVADIESLVVGFYKDKIKLSGGKDNNYETITHDGDLTVKNTTSSRDLMVDQIIAYPNPTNGTLFISNISDKGSYELISQSGSIIQGKTMFNGFNQLDISDLPVGVYFLKLYDHNRISINKITKQ
jgi:hypothetical protein